MGDGMNLYIVVFTVPLLPGVQNCVTFGANELAARSKIIMHFPDKEVEIRLCMCLKKEVFFVS